MIGKSIALALVVTATLPLSGCTGGSTCAAIGAVHQEFLAELAADPNAFSENEIRNERRAYTAARIGCAAFVQTSPVATK